jgi:hypothetical protein
MNIRLVWKTRRAADEVNQQDIFIVFYEAQHDSMFTVFFFIIEHTRLDVKQSYTIN